MRLPDPEADPVGFAKAYETAKAAPKNDAPAAGSIAAVIAAYRASAAYAGLKQSTRVEYDWALERVVAAWAALPVAGLKRPHIVRLQDQYSTTPRQADKIVRVLSACLTWAVDRGHAPTNPAHGVKGINKPKPIPAWTDADLSVFRTHWPLGTPQRLAIEIGAATGLRGSDAHRLQWNDVKDGKVRITQEKTGEPVSIPILPELADALAAAAAVSTHVLVGVRGRPYTQEGFETLVKRATVAAGLKLSFHGLRKYAAVRLVEAGCSIEEARAVTGHRTDAMLRRYAQTASKNRLAEAAVEKLQARKTR